MLNPDDHDLLAPIRDLYGAFYSAATPADALRMDMLLCMHAAVTLAIQAPRNPVNPIGPELERVTFDVEQAFTTARELVRECPTFRGLCEGERKRIEATLFDLFPPWSAAP